METAALTSHQLLTSLQPGQHAVVFDPAQPGRIVTQASRLGECYYITGPCFSERCPLILQAYFQAAEAGHDTPANAVALLNTALRDCQVPPEARVFDCHGLSDALHTLVGLLAAY